MLQGGSRTSQASSDDIINELKVQIRAQQDELLQMRNEAIERVCFFFIINIQIL